MPVDPRFYAPLGALTLGKIAELTGAELNGDPNTSIHGISPAATARRGDLAFVDGDGKATPDINPELSAVILTAANLKHLPAGLPHLVSPVARHAHGLAAFQLFRPRHLEWSGEDRIHPTAQVHAEAVLAPGVCVGPGAAIGARTRIGANSVVGPGVHIGRDAQIGANVSMVCTLAGDHVRLLSGARIGEAGFGVTPGPAGLEDAPHFGRVILQDHVTIGANTCVDRGVFDDTIIGERTKIDNLCQIAHNVVFGRSVLMAAFGGISGSVRIGNGAVLGGRVGVADHVKIGDGVRLAASSGVFRDMDDGQVWGGTPAKPIREWMREIAWLQKQVNPKKKT